MLDANTIQHIEQRRPPAHTVIYTRTDLLNQRPVRKKRPAKKAPPVGFPFSQASAGPALYKRHVVPNYGVHKFEQPSDLRSTDLPETVKDAAYEVERAAVSSESLPRNTALGTFFRSLLPPLGILALAVYFFFLSGQSWSVVSPLIDPIEDTMFHYEMAAYAGIQTGDILAGDRLAAERITGDPRVPGLPSAGINIPDPAPGAEEEDIPLDLMESFAWQSYTVKNGDSVSRIAQTHGISMDAVIASNNITNARRLQVGQVIRIPNMDGIPYTVKRGDNLTKISSAQGVPLSALLDANDIQSGAITPGTVLFLPGVRMRTEDLKLALGEAFAWPVRGVISSRFGWRNDPISGVRKNHAALDLAAKTGTPIRAAMDGKVATVGYNNTYGRFIILTHSNGYQTMYAHMSATSVKQGTRINQGSKIGEVGSTGYSTGPHLHFAIYKNGRAVNPLDFLN